MRQYNQMQIRAGIIQFCRKVKFHHPATAKAIGLSNRQAHLLKEVLCHKFSKNDGAPFDFPKLFICEDVRKALYHKNSTPNDIDLSDLNTVLRIIKLMSYVSRQEKNSKNGKSGETHHIDFSRPHTMEVLSTNKSDVVVVFHFI